MIDFEEVTNRLIGVYGDPDDDYAENIHSSSSCRNRPDGSDEAVDVLIETVLSQNTTDKNSHAAFLNLKRHWPLWSQVMTCDEKELADEIRVGGLAAIKAKRIQNILKILLEKTIAHSKEVKKESKKVIEPTLHYLDGMTKDGVMAALQELPGVGPKTAACTVVFGLGIDCIPVDTHVFRIAGKLGVTKGTTPEAVQTELEDIIPPHVKRPLHLLLLEHGRQVCTARKAMCSSCVLADICATGKKTVKRGPKRTGHNEAEESKESKEQKVKKEQIAPPPMKKVKTEELTN